MQSEPSIEQQLRALHAPRIEPPKLDAEAEAAALAEYDARHGDPAGQRVGRAGGGLGAGLLGLLFAHRVAVAVAAVLVVIVGACVLPTSYDIPLGLSVDIRAAAGEQLPAKDIARYVQERSGAAEVDVMVRESVHDGGAPQAEVSIRLWDQNLALGEIEAELREEFPALADAEIIETPLEGEVETIWARRLAHRAFRISLEQADVEQARRQLIAQLQAQGFAPDEIVVKVRDRDDGHREVQVQVERHHTGDGPPDATELPRFEWVMGPGVETERETVELEAPPGEPVRIHVQAGDE